MADETIVRTIKIDVEGANKSLASVDKAQEKVTASTGKLDSQMSALPGPLGKAKAGVKALGTAFKALLANPIVLLIAAIVAALAGLFKAFTKTQQGADKMKDAMAGVSAVVDAVVDRLAKLFKALVKVFQGDFKGAADEFRGAVTGIKDELIGAAQAAVAYEKAMRDLYNAETALITANAERTRQIAELRLLARDYTASVEERRDAIVEADRLEKESLEANLKLQEQRIANMKQDIENTPELQRTREQLRKLAEEEAKLIGLQTQSLQAQRKLKAELNTLDREVAAAAKAEADEQAKIEQEKADLLAAELEKKAAIQAEIDKAESERLAKLAEEERLRIESLETYKRNQRAITHEGRLENLRNELEAGAILQEEYDLRLIDLEAQHQQELADIKDQARIDQMNAERQAQADRERLAQEQIALEQTIAAAKEGIYQDSLNALIGFLGEGSKAAKAVAIADATKSAIQGAINAFTSVIKLPAPFGPILAPIAAASALAAGMANVRKIAQSPDPKLPGGRGSGGGSVPSVALARPDASAGVGDIVQTDVGIGQDVNIVQDRTSRRATKAYVVESEVTAAADLARQREQEVEL
jgi:hypothetical protein